MPGDSVIHDRKASPHSLPGAQTSEVEDPGQDGLFGM